MSTLAEMWQPMAVAESATRHWQLGACDAWIRHQGPEWRIAVRSGDDVMATRAPVVDHAPAPDNATWIRCISPDAAMALRVMPRLPDRPVISRPDHALSLMPGAECRFFIGIPAFLSFRLEGHGQDFQLHETAATTLSKSWAGSVVEGDLCYALRTTAKREVAELVPAAHRIVCPVEIRNRSAETLSLSRLTLPMGALDVFLGTTRLWANAIEATYLGDGEWSRLRPLPGPPPYDQAGLLLGPARNPADQGHLVPFFSELRTLAHL